MKLIFALAALAALVVTIPAAGFIITVFRQVAAALVVLP